MGSLYASTLSLISGVRGRRGSFTEACFNPRPGSPPALSCKFHGRHSEKRLLADSGTGDRRIAAGCACARPLARSLDVGVWVLTSAARSGPPRSQMARKSWRRGQGEKKKGGPSGGVGAAEQRRGGNGSGRCTRVRRILLRMSEAEATGGEPIRIRCCPGAAPDW